MNFLNFQIRQVVEISPKIILENDPIVVDENLQVENGENLLVETRTKKVQKTQKYDHTWARSWRSSGPKIGKWGRSSTPNSKNTLILTKIGVFDKKVLLFI